MSKDKDIETLIALGLIAVVGFGVYKVIKSFGSHEEGDEVEKSDLYSNKKYISEPVFFEDYDRKRFPEYFYYCEQCKRETGHGSCGHCIECYGGTVGGDCGMCESD